jgi:hypothetical protein
MADTWVLWGLDRHQLWRMPIELVRGSWEACCDAQERLRSGWITGPYREGCEPLGLLRIRSNHLLDNGHQIGETEPMTSTIGQQEAHNRAVKATAMLAVLDRWQELTSTEPMTADELQRLDDQGWQALARMAARQNGTDWTDASPQTRATVIGTLRQREATPDPFTGFPK